MKPFTEKEIQSYWDKKAKELETHPTATMKDFHLRKLEIETILSHLSPLDILVDLGAGNAFASIEYAKKCKFVYALDYSSNMVQQANQLIRTNSLKNILAQESNILEFQNQFQPPANVVNCTRVLINLPSSEKMEKALQILIQNIPPQGKLILTEGIESHFQNLNRLRTQMGLPKISLNWHNQLMNKVWLENTLQNSFERVQKVHYGLYYFISRVLHPLLVHPEEPKFDALINQKASFLNQQIKESPPFEEISVLVTYTGFKK